jgi:hypothetical protein
MSSINPHIDSVAAATIRLVRRFNRPPYKGELHQAPILYLSLFPSWHEKRTLSRLDDLAASLGLK